MRDKIILVLLSALLFLPLLGLVPLIDISETLPAELTREMLLHDNYSTLTLAFQEYTQTPPLFNWLQGLSFYFFGENEMAARLPNAICGIFTLLFIFHFATQNFNKRLAYWWVISYAASLLPHLYMKSGVIDPWFNLFFFVAICYIYKCSLQQRDWIDISIAGISLGLAILTKGTLALGILVPVGAFVYYFRKRDRILYWWQLLLLLSMAVLIAFVWYGIVYYNHGFKAVLQIIKSQFLLFESGESFQWKGLYYHSFLLLMGCFPASIFLWDSFKQQNLIDKAKNDFVIWMRTILVFVLIWVSVLHTTNFLYSSICYLPLTFLSAYSLAKLETQQLPWRKTKVTIIMIAGILLGIIIFLIPFFGNYQQFLTVNAKSEFWIDVLNNKDIKWYIWESIVGLLFIIAIIVAGSFIARRKYSLGTSILFISCVAMIQLSIYLFLPKIEKYIQQDTLSFVKEHPYPQAKVEPLFYKSYLPYFYGKVGEEPTEKVYGISKIIDKDEVIKKHPKYKILKEKNGYVYYEIQ